jgi:hypothetical protein
MFENSAKRRMFEKCEGSNRVQEETAIEELPNLYFFLILLR